MLQIMIDVVKKRLINQKAFSTLEVIETLEKENEQLKAQIEKMKNNFDEELFDKAVEVMNEYDNLKKENEELKAFCNKLINANNELRNSLRKYEIVPDVDYLPNGLEVYKENVGDNPYGVK